MNVYRIIAELSDVSKYNTHYCKKRFEDTKGVIQRSNTKLKKVDRAQILGISGTDAAFLLSVIGK
jgi:hypothetical protein